MNRRWCQDYTADLERVRALEVERAFRRDLCRVFLPSVVIGIMTIILEVFK